MISKQEITKTIEHSFYTLKVLQTYCQQNKNIFEMNPVEYLINDLFNKMDTVYAKIYDNKII